MLKDMNHQRQAKLVNFFEYTHFAQKRLKMQF